MRPEDFAITYQDTDAGPYDGGSSGSQTTFNNGRAVVEAAREVAPPAPRARRRRPRGERRRPRAARRPCRGRRQPGPAGVDRRARRRRPTTGRCSSPAARGCRPTRPSTTPRPASAGSGSSRSPRRRYFCHAVADPGRPGDGHRPDAQGRGRDRRRAGPEPDGRRGPDDRRRRDGPRQRDDSRARVFGGDGRQRNASLLDYKLLTTRRRARDRDRLRRAPGLERRPARLEGRRRAADRPDRGRRRERDRDGDRRPRPAPADDPGARLAGGHDRRRRRDRGERAVRARPARRGRGAAR